jgi:hypothetical protein
MSATLDQHALRDRLVQAMATGAATARNALTLAVEQFTLARQRDQFWSLLDPARLRNGSGLACRKRLGVPPTRLLHGSRA